MNEKDSEVYHVPQELGKVDHNSIEYVPFRKDFYVEVPEIANMTKEEVEAYRSVSHCYCTSLTFMECCTAFIFVL